MSSIDWQEFLYRPLEVCRNSFRVLHMMTTQICDSIHGIGIVISYQFSTYTVLIYACDESDAWMLKTLSSWCHSEPKRSTPKEQHRGTRCPERRHSIHKTGADEDWHHRWSSHGERPTALSDGWDGSDLILFEELGGGCHRPPTQTNKLLTFY